MNEKPFSYICRFGTQFTCPRCDFDAPVKVITPPKNIKQRMSDVAEMIGYHAVNIRPELNGFRGYDCIEFV